MTGAIRHRIHDWPWRRIFAATVATILAIAIVPPLRRAVSLAIGDVVLFAAAPFAPKIADFSQLPTSTRLTAADGSVIGDIGSGGLKDTKPIALRDVPPRVRNAVMAAEDKDFYHHGGVDPAAVTRAAFETLRGHSEGGSTITQQVAKINYTAGEHTVFRKIKELLYASRLERKYTKDQLLERYLNQVYFGDGAYGIAAASVNYFGVPPAKLSVSQAAVLAGKIRAPEILDPRTNPQPMKARRDQVLRNMQKQGWLDKPALTVALAEPMVAQPRPLASAGLAPHFVSYVEREAKTLDALGGSPATRASQLFTGGYRIETTLDPKTFNATVASVQARLGAGGDPTTAVATVKPGDGAIRSLFGGLDFASTQFDMSSRGGRQAGSSFKPFVYLAALRDKIDPRSTFDGTSGRVIPCYGTKPVNNYAGEDASGAINLDDALAHSVNVVFVDLGCKVGPKAVLNAANDAGIPDGATTAQGAIFLGGLDRDGVNALEMASAFATFAADGVYTQPYAITRIVDRKGKVVYQHKVSAHRAFSADEVGVLNTPLQKVVKEGTGTAANIGRPVAGKTGTTQDNVDAWFVGYTPDLATGVWVGHAKPKPMRNVHGRAVTGGSFPAQIFSDVMRAAEKGMPVKQLHTTSPDALGLHMVSPETKTSAPTATSLVPTSVTLPGETTTSTTRRPRETTTSTTSRPRNTTTSSTTRSTTSTTSAPGGKKGASASTTTTNGP
ncbi:MAG: penicillin-binding protein [Actinomycetota bacterium]|jgi:membrane peptidoglycan carboxypeptidase